MPTQIMAVKTFPGIGTRMDDLDGEGRAETAECLSGAMKSGGDGGGDAVGTASAHYGMRRYL